MSSSPIAIIFIGFPGCGKSTTRNKIISSGKKFTVVSLDDILERYAQRENISYSQAFEKYVKKANFELKKIINNAVSNKENIIFDQTNLSKNKRIGLIKRLRDNGYKKIIGVFFDIPIEKCMERCKKREKETGKTISKSTFEKMCSYFEKPDINEGFDEIKIIKA